jgi:methionine synthase II (cobalamin-independent)
VLYAWKQYSVTTQNSFESTKVNEGQEAKQPKKKAKVSAPVKGSIASYKSTYEAKEHLCSNLAKFLKEVQRKHKHQRKIYARFPEHICV